MDISYTNVLEGARQYFQGLPATTSASSANSPAISASITDPGRQQQQHQPHQQQQQQQQQQQAHHLLHRQHPQQYQQHHHHQQPRLQPHHQSSRPATHRPPQTYNDGSVRSEQHSAVPVYWDQQNEGQAAANLTNASVTMDHHQQQQQLMQHRAGGGGGGGRTVISNQSPLMPVNYPPSSYKANHPVSNGAPLKSVNNSSASKMHHMYAPSSHVSHAQQVSGGGSKSYYELQNRDASKSYAAAPPTSCANGNKSYGGSGGGYSNIPQQQQPQQQPAPTNPYHSYPSSSLASSSSHDTRSYNMYTPATRSNAQYGSNYYAPVDVQCPPQLAGAQRRYLPMQPSNMYPQSSSRTSVSGGSMSSSSSNNAKANLTRNVNMSSSISAASSYNGSVQSSNNNPYYTNASYKSTSIVTYTTTSVTLSTSTYVHPPLVATAKNYPPMPPTKTTNMHQRMSTPQQQPPPPHSSQPATASHANRGMSSMMMKPKRESPLDLSVKTVRTSADSTLGDHEDRHTMPAQIARHPQSMGAPKVDFLPNFTLQKDQHQSSRPTPLQSSHSNNYYNYSYATSALPKVDFDFKRKRSLEYATPSALPEKMPKTDTWRQTIDRQIDQRINSYTQAQMHIKSQQLQQQPVVNGNVRNPPMQPPPMQTHMPPMPKSHYPYAPHSNSHMPRKVEEMPQKSQATKKVLNLLRTSLQNKGVKISSAAMPKKSPERVQNYREILQPSTDVLAPLQPKPGIVGRRNASPFTAASLERSSNTPPMYKFHIPKAIDSVIISDGEKEPEATVVNQSNSDLDGLAAFLAARIRTKAELKQVGTNDGGNNNSFTNTTTILKKELSAVTPPPLISSAAVTPKKLFGRNEMKRSDVRSSSETSIFDFPDSDTEAELPVLDRQTLIEMRKDRKPVKPAAATDSETGERPASPFSLLFQQTCDIFVEQLKFGCGKKRGRRKKECSPTTTGEIVDGEMKMESEIKLVVVKKENSDELVEDATSTRTSDISKPEIDIKTNVNSERESNDSALLLSVAGKPSDTDSDAPLASIITKQKKKFTKRTSKDGKILQKLKKTKKQELDESLKEISSDSEVEALSRNRKNDFYNQLKSQILICKPGKKPTFGDGSDFRPGWEEALYRYKKSIRIPMQLIQVTRPPSSQRLSTSLPDLDPCPISPAPKTESIDSDMDSSSCSFNFIKANYDSDQGSIKSFCSKSSILDKLLERYGGKKRKRSKKDEVAGAKIIPKSENELLPTPNLDIKGAVSKSAAALLGFRKKTIDSFKDAFIHNSSKIAGEFNTVVMKARTRTENRVLKEKATIREVFGEDRPASAPPVTCVDELKPDEPSKHGKENKLTNEFSDVLLKALECKKLEIDVENIKKEKDEDDNITVVSTDSIETTSRKKNKLRRKGSSGFDYIRKKKKQIKKEDEDASNKSRRRNFVSKATPASIDDIQKEIKQWVLNKGVGETHLHRASRSGLTDIAAYCLEKMSCNPSPKDNAGYTPLHEACAKGHLDIARLLLEYGAEVSDSAQGGIRPLHEAAENGFVEIIRLLLSYGADPTLATYSGVTPLQLASDDATVLILEEHLNELQGRASPWIFLGPASIFDQDNSGYDPFADVPEGDDRTDSEDMDIVFEVSEQLLPNLYTLPDCDPLDRWVLLQDLTNVLKIKSKETLLRQLNITSVTMSDLVLEMQMDEFLQKAQCCQFLHTLEKLNTDLSKISLVKYTDKVRRLLNVEQFLFTNNMTDR